MAARTPGQPSLFGVAASDPAPEDLAGLLAGPGRVGRMGGTARVSVVVDAAWRVHALVAELTLRGLPASWAGGASDTAGIGAPGRSSGASDAAGFTVRTAYTTRLVPLARAWLAGPPAGLHLNGQALRLWVAAAGGPCADGYLLGLGGADQDSEARWAAVGAALSAAGLGAALVVPGAGPAAYRITGRRRLARLAELVGDPPPAAPPAAWPDTSGQS